jgi:hypothetical protein
MRFLLAGLLLIPLGLFAARWVEATHAMPCPDLNGDGALTTVDLAILASYDGQSVPPAPAAADLNSDGVINSADADFILTLIPPPGGAYTCQDTPIGVAGAVGGEARLADVADSDDGGLPMLTIAVPALVSWLFVVALALVRR